MRNLLVLFAIIAFCSLAAVTSAQQPEGLGLVKTSCVACHGLGKVCKNTGKADSFWNTKINVMIKQWGMKDPGADKVALMAGYLGGLPEKAAEICGN